ncbi:MAG: hypothetical protein MR304_05830 [Eubacterium sp.]|nr:hypothetical protein [Eubacterium sp.]
MSRKRMLYRYEFSRLKWFLVAGLALCAFVLLIFNSGCQMDNIEWSVSENTFLNRFLFRGQFSYFGFSLTNYLEFFTLPAILFLGGMTVYQCSDYHKRTKREFMASLPYTQQERFLAKLVAGVGTITVYCLAFGIGVFGLRAYYYEWMMRSYLVFPEYKLILANDTWVHTLRTLLLLWLIMLAAYGIYLLLHSVVTNGIAASLMGVGVMLSPAWLAYQWCVYSEFLHPDPAFPSDAWLEHHPAVTRLCKLFMGGGYYRDCFTVDPGENSDLTILLLDFCSSGKVIAAVVVLLIVVVVVAWWINARQDGARFGQVVPLTAARIVIGVGMAVCFGTAITRIALSVLQIENVIAICFILVAVCIGIYLLVDRILKRTVR